jgi:hypothetical protein
MRQAQKRGRSRVRVSLDQVRGSQKERSADLIALDISITALEKIDARKCKVVELRHFGGLSLEDCSSVEHVNDHSSARLEDGGSMVATRNARPIGAL